MAFVNIEPKTGQKNPLFMWRFTSAHCILTTQLSEDNTYGGSGPVYSKYDLIIVFNPDIDSDP